MKTFEQRTSYKIRYSQTEIEHDKKLLNSYMPSDEVSSLKIEFEEYYKVLGKETIREENKVSGLAKSVGADKIQWVILNSKENKSASMGYIVNQEEEIKGNYLAKLGFGHKVTKDQVINYALKLFILKKSYEYNYLCDKCNKIVQLTILPLYCGCVWTRFGEKVKFNNLIKREYERCDEKRPLTAIDVGLINDFISVMFTSLMISDHLKKKRDSDLMNSFK
jgi:hypothetical protein